MNKTIAITLLTTSLLAGTAGTFAGEPAGRSLIESHLSIIPDGYDLVEATGSGKTGSRKAQIQPHPRRQDLYLRQPYEP